MSTTRVRLIHNTNDGIGFFLTKSGSVCVIRGLKRTSKVLGLYTLPKRCARYNQGVLYPVDTDASSVFTSNNDDPGRCGPPHLFEWMCGIIEDLSSRTSLTHTLKFREGRCVKLGGPLPPFVQVGNFVCVFNIREGFANTGCIRKRTTVQFPEAMTFPRSFEFFNGKWLACLRIKPNPSESLKTGRIVWSKILVPAKCDTKPLGLCSILDLSKMAHQLVTGKMVSPPLRPTDPRPVFVCPLLFAWYDRTSVGASRLWTSTGLSRLFGIETLPKFLHSLVCTVFVRYPDPEHGTCYLEDTMNKFFVPLLGDGSKPPQIEREFERAEVAASLRASGAKKVAPYMTHALLDSKRCEEQMLILEEESMGSRRWALDLRRGLRKRIGYSSSLSEKKTTPCDTQNTVTKTELLNLGSARQALRRWTSLLREIRKGNSEADRQRAERAKKKVDFLKALLKAGTPNEAANTLTNVVTYAKRTPIGRLIPRWPSMTQCPSDLRGTLCTQHSDIDMKNCHPVLLLQMAEKAGLDVPRLSKYVCDRTNVINMVSSYYGGIGRGWIKELFLRIINGGGLKRWLLKIISEDPLAGQKARGVVQKSGHCPFVELFRSEVGCLREVVIARQPGAEKVLQQVQKLRPTECKDRWSLFSWCLTEVESECLLAVADFFERKRSIPVDTLVFDGAIVRSKVLTSQDLKDCEKHVFARTSWKITLVHKPFPAETTDTK